MVNLLKSFFNPPPLSKPVSIQETAQGFSCADWNLDTPILRLPTGDLWNLGDACQGVLIMGATGSGKSSGSADLLALKYLRLGAGGIVLCVKVEEADYWMEIARLTGRENDIIRMTEKDEAFNVFDYEHSREGRGAGLTMNLVNLFRELQDLIEGNPGQKPAADFWERSCFRLIANAIQLQCTLPEPLTLKAIAEIISSAPRSAADMDDPTWTDTSKCFNASSEALVNHAGDDDVQRAASYFLNDFPAMGDRQRSGLLETWEGLADPLLRSPIRQRFCTETTFTPEDAIERGKIIVVDLPVKEFNHAGRIAGVIVKFIFQKAVERRQSMPDEQRRPCFIWADEFQHFVTKYDMVFQQTARSSKTSTVYIGQNTQTVLAALGGQAGEPFMLGLFGNLLTKIFHANNEEKTTKFAAGVIGEDWQNIESTNEGENRGLLTPPLGGTQSSSTNVSPQLKYLVQPIEFNRLRTGTKRNDRKVDAILVQAGRIFQNNHSYCKTHFKQRNR